MIEATIKWLSANKDLLTLTIAALGIPIVLFQIAQGERQERKRVVRRRQAAIATLPLTLSEICGYTKEMMYALSPAYRWSVSRQGNVPAFEPPSLPAEVVAALERMVEAAPNGRVAKAIAAIISDLQVLFARTRPLMSELSQNRRAEALSAGENILLAAKIYARAEGLLDFARSLSTAPEPRAARLITALNLAGLRNDHYAGIHDRLEKKKANENANWLGGLIRRTKNGSTS